MSGDPTWVRRTGLRLRPDPARVVATLFLPGQETLASGESRATAVLDRVLALTDIEVGTALADVSADFRHRHDDLTAMWERHAALVEHRLSEHPSLSKSRRQLIGAYFTQEFAVEAAALFNPSVIAHPDQSGMAVGSTRFLLSVRAVGEGHLSSIEFRTGTVDADGIVALDQPERPPVLPHFVPTPHSREVFRRQVVELDSDHGDSHHVLESLPEEFTQYELDVVLSELDQHRLTLQDVDATVQRFRRIAACNYTVRFDPATPLHDRVLMPRGPSESHGMEDVRLVRLTHDDGSVEILGSYTAYDGSSVVPQLLRSRTLDVIDVAQLSGPGAKNKGLAIFPRQVKGRYLALSRADRESNALSESDDLLHWCQPVPLQQPQHPWEIVQLGNCGSPLETVAGWLVLTHGVGPMREYGIGALLLDLEDPSVVIGRLPTPLLTVTDDERDGYVPNVVYTCGAMVNADLLVLPYGCADASIAVALVDLPRLLAELAEAGP